MKKDELISLTDKMCKELLIIINEQKEATKEQVANYLTESAQIIMNVKKEDISSAGFAESLFHNAYQEIAKKSLSSYANTNANIKKLTQMHEETLQECDDKHINLPALTSKFNEIQNQMSDEVKKANEVITQLTNQVKTLEEKSNLDSLTKVFNRRALSSYLKNICSHDKLPYSFHMLMLDIDDFKNINDSHGHLAGDKVLIFIANILKKTLRDGDKVFRYGGEEFIIILNRIDD
ncbi:MAG: GGDEF domain-containing protein, partial [Campylobacterota bacterium]|nr:GGDEF domain-containing protein [Campylobacterota bacterium]